MEGHYSHIHWTKNRFLIKDEQWANGLKSDETIRLPSNFDPSHLAETNLNMRDLIRDKKPPQRQKYTWKADPMDP
ncbi:uncharacterized protein B0P05DRAFT_524782 [Gilbertella persicaria]|uniref:uncharacterized protein n=1 Tax=Gilbertella persicaria TaxID=101096 RepID=UPI00221F6A95|nr:uncharacterized protein B0P05DRAFT_524782 [Gilbertella persicaria]KAI8095118.1 hypothetical protein B0P05DRAFT_524782 [Gilbertella persicaria]